MLRGPFPTRLISFVNTEVQFSTRWYFKASKLHYLHSRNLLMNWLRTSSRKQVTLHFFSKLSSTFQRNLCQLGNNDAEFAFFLVPFSVIQNTILRFMMKVTQVLYTTFIYHFFPPLPPACYLLTEGST